mmetsp:Transcript_59600/g.103997  ORF Transcript_59600/g.103997 Transcript_59600/m.103997 type:complete len:350 (+) Transcript_59600:84-1133(+)
MQISRSSAKPTAGYPITQVASARPMQVGSSTTVSGAPGGAVFKSPMPAPPMSPVVAGGTTVAGSASRPPSTISMPQVRQARVLSGQPMTSAARPLAATASSPPPVTYAAQSVVASAAGPVMVSKPAVMRPNTTAGPAYTQNAYEVKHQDDPQLQNLKELRKTSGLKHIPVNAGLQGFKTGASDGKLTREQFLDAYAQVLQAHAVEVPTEPVRNAVFDLFDRDDNHIVDMMELICGISLLCAGTEDDKINAVFNIFDENGDGFISMEEMFKFLTSVFKVVLTPNVMAVMNSMGVTVESAEDLASVTALECFKTADLNQDGKLSVTEFKNWFYAPRNDPSFLFMPVRKLLQ